MNDHLHICDEGLRLIKEFEGAPRTVARLCEGGRWELGWGCTFHTDDRPVLEGETCDEAYAEDLLEHAVEVFEEVVKRHVTVPLTQHQFSALVVLVYNIGEENFATGKDGPCTALKETNKSRAYDAAAAFGRFVYATKGKHKQALRGLLRRHYAEGCLYLGYDWTEACDDDFIRMKVERPPGNVGTDKVLFKTPWADVLHIAQSYPLAAPRRAPSVTIITDQPASPVRADDKAGQPERPPNPAPAAPAKEPAKVSHEEPVASKNPPIVSTNPAAPTSGPSAAAPAVQAAPAPPVSTHPGNAPVPKVTFPKEEPKVAPPVVVAGQDGAKPKSPNTTLPADVPYKIDVNAGLKPIDESDRVKGYVIQQIGIGAIRLGSLGVFGTTIQAGAQTVQGDPVLSNIVLMGVVAGGIAITGYVVKVYGTWKRRRGEEKAAQALF